MHSHASLESAQSRHWTGEIFTLLMDPSASVLQDNLSDLIIRDSAEGSGSTIYQRFIPKIEESQGGNCDDNLEF